MQKAELFKYIRHPEHLNEESLTRLLKVKESYPYFQTVHLLAVKGKFIHGDDDCQTFIESASAYVPDRRVLYDLLYPLFEKAVSDTDTVTETGEITGTDIQTPKSESVKPTLRDNISNLLILQLEELELVDPAEAELVPEIALDIDKEYGTRDDDHQYPSESADDGDLLTIEEASSGEDLPDPNENPEPPPVSPEKKSGHNELIEKFIENNPRLEPLHGDQPEVDISEDSVKENDGIFTDTLARIYIKQGYYNKAIFAYEKLILKYPEKSDYFAGQIESIKKLTNKQ
jgi:tetratricopeptide (TPR) repeat protein